MKKENKLLIIFAVTFTLIAVLFLVGFGMFKTNKELTVYKTYVKDATKFKHESIESGLITRKTTLYKGSEIVGYAYLGSDAVDGIPMTTGLKELRIEVIIDKDNNIKGVRVDFSEHTPDYIKFVQQYFEKLPDHALIDYKLVDEVAGASAKSMPIVRDVLDQVTKLATGSEPNPKELPDPHKDLFENKETVEEDTAFTKTDAVTKKEIVKDAEGTVLGHVYTVVDSTSKDPKSNLKEIPYTGEGKLEYLIGVDLENNIVGFYQVVNNHSGSYFNKYETALAALIGQPASDASLDNIADSTISGNALNRILEALKAVLE